MTWALGCVPSNFVLPMVFLFRNEVVLTPCDLEAYCLLDLFQIHLRSAYLCKNTPQQLLWSPPKHACFYCIDEAHFLSY